MTTKISSNNDTMSMFFGMLSTGYELYVMYFVIVHSILTKKQATDYAHITIFEEKELWKQFNGFVSKHHELL